MLLRYLLTIFNVAVVASLLLIFGLAFLFYRYGQDLPDYKQLVDYEHPVATRVHAANGQLLAEYAKERRAFVPVDAMPNRVVNAFLSAEDKNFFNHPGLDFLGIVRAFIANIGHLARNDRLEGASTITQQVAKNFLLTNEVSVERKVKEAILAFRIEKALSKERILELYLNKIYLGYGSYGVAAAALNYFDKSLYELSLSELAFIAGLPKAPNNYHPIKNHKLAFDRRNWVLGRLFIDGRISSMDLAEAIKQPLVVKEPRKTEFFLADYFLEETRRFLINKFGSNALYEGGLSVRTSLSPVLQNIADQALRMGLIRYDKKYGWRGAIGRIDQLDNWEQQLSSIDRVPGQAYWKLAVVLELTDKTAGIGLKDGTRGVIPLSRMKWAREQLDNRKKGSRVTRPADVLEIGDVVLVERISIDEIEAAGSFDNVFDLRQIPEVSGAIVAMNPHTGRVYAMTGGYSFDMSEFNRATQAKRQPGSAFKPFVYLAALDEGFTPSTLVLDAPFVIDQGYGLGKWKPANYTKKFYGPSPMRLGVEKSRNLMTVRLAQTIGIDKIVSYAQKFDVMGGEANHLSYALGAGETTLLRLTNAYSMLVNGGKRIKPTLIDRIQDRKGNNIFKEDLRECADCRLVWNEDLLPPNIPDIRGQIASPASSYQVVSMLEGVVQRGTGKVVRQIGKPLAGKTGTTNKSFDTWFIGFSPDLVVGIYVGFDSPATLGKETGSSLAAPIFKDFIEKALDGKPGVPFRIPPGIRLVKVNQKTGLLARPGEKKVLLEAFKPGTEPKNSNFVIEGESLDSQENQFVTPGVLY